MWCLVYLETAASGSLSRLLKTNGFEVHLTNDIDDLLDQLWYYGSDVACIVIEGHNVPGLGNFVDAIIDWPEIPVLAYGCIVQSIDSSIINVHRSELYSFDRVVHDLHVFQKRVAATHC